jgi:hypothetical protein
MDKGVGLYKINRREKKIFGFFLEDRDFTQPYTINPTPTLHPCFLMYSTSNSECKNAQMSTLHQPYTQPYTLLKK